MLYMSLIKNTNQVAALTDILTKTHGAINTNAYLGELSGGNKPNLPVAEVNDLHGYDEGWNDCDCSNDVPDNEAEELVVVDPRVKAQCTVGVQAALRVASCVLADRLLTTE